jgi:hypothetical protein
LTEQRSPTESRFVRSTAVQRAACTTRHPTSHTGRSL